MWSCIPGVLREIVISLKFRQNPLHGFQDVGGRKLPFPILTASGLYNSLYYRTSRDIYSLCTINFNGLINRNSTKCHYCHIQRSAVQVPRLRIADMWQCQCEAPIWIQLQKRCAGEICRIHTWSNVWKKTTRLFDRFFDGEWNNSSERDCLRCTYMCTLIAWNQISSLMYKFN